VNLNRDSILEFNDAFFALQTQLGSGKVAIDFNRLRKLVRSDTDSAYACVQLYRKLAETKREHFGNALIIARAYELETGDMGLVAELRPLAEALGAMDLFRAALEMG